MPNLLYQLFEYYQKPENRNVTFRNLNDVDAIYGWHDGGLYYYDPYQPDDIYGTDLTTRIHSSCMYTIEIEAIGNANSMCETIRPETPTKVYELFQHYLDPSNKNDTFTINDIYTEQNHHIGFDGQGITVYNIYEDYDNTRDLSKYIVSEDISNLNLQRR